MAATAGTGQRLTTDQRSSFVAAPLGWTMLGKEARGIEFGNRLGTEERTTPARAG
jgi:hypothetical protein